MIHTRYTLKVIFRKKYKKLILFSGHDTLFHFLFGHIFTYVLLLFTFFAEEFLISLNIIDNNKTLFYTGIFIGLITAIFIEYLLFNKLDDINETHNQYALAGGTFIATASFFILDLFNLESNTLMLIDLCFIILPIILLITVYFKFWKESTTLIIRKIRKLL